MGKKAFVIYYVLFFVRNYPENWRLVDANYFMGSVEPRLVESLTHSLKRHPPLQHFFTKDPSAPLTGVVMRVTEDTVNAALDLARHQLDGIIDGLSVVMDEQTPEVASAAVVSDERHPDGTVYSFVPKALLFIQSSQARDLKAWEDRNRKFLTMMLPFFDVATALHKHQETALQRQLAFSLKMFRHGRQSGSFSTEFVCKFSALEGLVCGGTSGSKGLNLQTRLPALFRKAPTVTPEYVKKLWKLRNDAVHESKGFYSSFSRGTKPVEVYIDQIEWLFGGVVTFAVSNLKTALSVTDLWRRAGQYSLPDFALQRREDGLMRFVGSRLVQDTRVRLKDALELCKRCIAAANNSSDNDQDSAP